MDPNYYFSVMMNVFEHFSSIAYIPTKFNQCLHVNGKVFFISKSTSISSYLIKSYTSVSFTFTLNAERISFDTLKKSNLTPLDFIKILRFMQIVFTNDVDYLEQSIKCINMSIVLDTVEINKQLYSDYIDIKTKYDELSERYENICRIIKSV